LLLIGVIASAIGVALALLIDWWPALASEQGRKIDTLYDVLLIVSVPIFVLVVTVVLYCVWRFRVRPGQEHLDGPPMHGNTRVEVVWTAIPALLLLALCTYAYVVLDDIEDAKGQAPMEVRVVGEQFTWTFFYRNPRGGSEISSNRLYLPTNTSVKFNVQSKDVIHDFWVPAFRLKIDAVPGITTNFKATTMDSPGTYPVVCAELCGLGHAVMRQTATVMPQDEYRSWLNEQATAGGGPVGTGGAEEAGGGGTAELDGGTIFTSAEARCGQCHTLSAAGAEASGTIGPNLDESLRGKDEEYIRRGIVDPDADVVDGYQPGIMPPNYEDTLRPEEVDALVTYLTEVTK
jgi:cytochrome c oxidase subunit 2